MSAIHALNFGPSSTSWLRNLFGGLLLIATALQMDQFFIPLGFTFIERVYRHAGMSGMSTGYGVMH